MSPANVKIEPAASDDGAVRCEPAGRIGRGVVDGRPMVRHHK